MWHPLRGGTRPWMCITRPVEVLCWRWWSLPIPSSPPWWLSALSGWPRSSRIVLVRFRRELPALRAVLADARRIDLLVVDGYVHLDAHGRPGRGRHPHAHAAFAGPVIGVAKTPFRGPTHAIEMRRGGASRSLYVTAV